MTKLTKKAWHDTNDLGKKLKRVFNMLDTRTRKTVLETSELTSLANSMCQIAIQLVNIKKSTEIEQRLATIENKYEQSN